MKHLITGGCGFLGNLIARHLSARQEEVRIIDVWKDETLPAEVEFVQCDVLDRDGVAKVMKGIDVVHHTAALVPLTKSGKRFRDVNVDGSKIVAEEAARAQVGYFIHTSSSAIFGAPPCPADNNSPLEPLEIYGRSKLDGELAVKEVAQNTGMPFISVRPRTIIGEGRLGIFQILFEWIKEGIDVYVIGNGQTKIQFLHADDLIAGYLLLHDLKKTGLYNIGTDRYNTIAESLEHLIQHAGTKSKVRRLPKSLTVGTLSILDQVGLSPLAPWHYLTYGEDFYFDVKPLLDLGWKPKYSNDEMLAENYDSFIANYDSLMAAKTNSPHRKRVKEQLLSVVKALSR